MSDRRAARVAQSAAGRVRYLGNDLPPQLAGGPCIEDSGRPEGGDGGMDVSEAAMEPGGREWAVVDGLGA